MLVNADLTLFALNSCVFYVPYF